MAAPWGGKPVEYRSGGRGGAICAAAIAVRCGTSFAGVLCEDWRQGAAGGDRPQDSDVELRGNE